MAKGPTFSDKDKGFKKLVESLGEMGAVVIGVQGKQAKEQHPNAPLKIGELAAAHELGLVPGAPARSWLRQWMDENAARLSEEAAAEFKAVMARKTTRNTALKKLGYKWTSEVRERIDSGKVPPPLAASTVARKGHSTPLLDTATLRNSITYKVYLPQIKSIRDKGQRVVARKRGRK